MKDLALYICAISFAICVSVSDVTPLRIVLLGKSMSENSLVGNFILGRAAFDSEAPPDVVERVGGRLKDRHVTIINSPQLLQTNISDHQITQSVRECVYLSDPGPHVIVLLLKHDQCSAEDQECVEKVLRSFSESVYQHTMVLSTQEPTDTSDILQKIIQKCANRHFSLQRSSSPDDLLQTLEHIEKINDGRYLDCAEASQCFMKEQQTTERRECDDVMMYVVINYNKSSFNFLLLIISVGVKLNLVVCGSDGSLKSSISEQIRQQTDRRSDVELHDRLINLVELPALIRLSEEEVMRQTLRCVYLCHPGVHAFLLVIPDAPLNNEDKAEMEEIQKIFDSREHFMVLFISDLPVDEHVEYVIKYSSETQRLISHCGGQYKVMRLNEPENSRQIPKLLDYIENMKTEPYSLQMYVKVQNRARHELEEKLSKMENKIKELEQKIQSEGKWIKLI